MKKNEVQQILCSLARALTQWGDAWCNSDPEQVLAMSHIGCSRDSRPQMVCSDCGEPMHARVAKIRATPEVMANRVSRGSGAVEE